MNARFSIRAPDAVEITLDLTATVTEWKKLRAELREAESPEATELERKLAYLIDQAVANLATERWTTGYASGPVTTGDQSQ